MEKKVINLQDKKEEKKGISLDEFIKDGEKPVTRGELIEILAQLITRIDTELTEAFKGMSTTALLVELMLQTLEDKGILNLEDIRQQHEKVLKGVKKDGGETIN